MKKLPTYIIVFLFFIIGTLSGCTEFQEDLGEALEGDVVSVSVYAYADVVNGSDIPLQTIQVQFDLSKTGGKDFTYTVNVDSNGRALCPYVGYNLHEGEIIFVSASIAGIMGGADSLTITFSNAKKIATDNGNGDFTLQWEPELNLSV